MSVSLVMIVKNEEEHLGRCLESVSGLVDEMVIVDTGSTDRTKEIATSFGAHVYDFEWVDDFSKARNYALQFATKGWVLSLDADQYIALEHRESLRAFFRTLSESPVNGYLFREIFVHYEDPLFEDYGERAVRITNVRLFKRLPEFQWKYRVHEQIVPLFSDVLCPVPVTHEWRGNKELRKVREEYYYNLARLDHEEYPDDFYPFYTIAAQAFALERYEEMLVFASEYYKRVGPHRMPPDDFVVKHLLAHVYLGYFTECWMMLFSLLEEHPAKLFLLWFQAFLYKYQKKYAQAEAVYRKVIRIASLEKEMSRRFSNPMIRRMARGELRKLFFKKSLRHVS